MGDNVSLKTDRSGSILDRVSATQNNPLTETQALTDQLVSASIQEGTNLKTAAAMLGAGWVGRFTRIGAMASLPGQALARGLSYVPALATESAAFAGIERAFYSSSQPFQKDWARAAVTLAGLKAFGGISRGQNIILQHLFTDLGLVGGHQAGSTLGLMDKPQGSFARQMLFAEATNWQMKGSLAFAHSLSPRLPAMERSLDIFLNTRKTNIPSEKEPSSLLSRFGLATEGAPEAFLSSSKSEESKGLGLLRMSDGGEGGGSGKKSGDPLDRSQQPDSIHRRYQLITTRLVLDPRQGRTVLEEILTSDEDPVTRMTAAETLGNWGDPAARPALEWALEDISPQVREAADWALKNIAKETGNASSVPSVKIISTIPPPNTPENIPPLFKGETRAVGRPNPDWRKKLNPLDKKSLPAASSPANDFDRPPDSDWTGGDFREFEIRKAPKASYEGPLPSRADAERNLENPDPELRMSALHDLALLVDPAAVPALEKALQNEKDPRIQPMIRALLFLHSLEIASKDGDAPQVGTSHEPSRVAELISRAEKGDPDAIRKIIEAAKIDINVLDLFGSDMFYHYPNSRILDLAKVRLWRTILFQDSIKDLTTEEPDRKEFERARELALQGNIKAKIALTLVEMAHKKVRSGEISTTTPESFLEEIYQEIPGAREVLSREEFLETFGISFEKARKE